MWRRLQMIAGLVLLTISSATSAEEPAPTTVEIRAPVSNARVFIDGAPEGSKLNVPIPVEAGSHELSVEAEGHAVYKRWIHVDEGGALVVEVELLPLSAPPGLPKGAPIQDPAAGDATKSQLVRGAEDDDAWYERWWVWAALGVLAVGGTVFLVAASGGDDFVPGGELGRTSTRDWMSP